MTYHTLSKPVTSRIEIKKSAFIVYAYPVNDREAAMFHVKQLREQYPDARHHCWAYIIGNPSNTTSAGFDDDGEPSGTAGKPILNVLQHKNIGNVIVVVVRYFGGIKLGAGGLTRAYAGSAQAAVDVATEKQYLTRFVPQAHIRIQADFADESQVRYVLDDMGGQISDVEYSESVILKATLPERLVPELQERLPLTAAVLQESIDDQ